ncbi:outer dense fiber protein 2 isoform X2 [Petromyzon marinus]|uniref:outer dense fiber protein 2 isoform X2 n=1 Tax=Petromyzon marinus TaxID=7757 RepID=UPI003F6F5ACF
MKIRTGSPPVHVHVDEDTPVHVHLKKTRKPRVGAGATEGRTVGGERASARSTPRGRSRGPWIPPGKTSVRDKTYAWEGPTHRLEISPPRGADAGGTRPGLHVSDLTTTDVADGARGEEGAEGDGEAATAFEKTVDGLLAQVDQERRDRARERAASEGAAWRQRRRAGGAAAAPCPGDVDLSPHENEGLRRRSLEMRAVPNGDSARTPGGGADGRDRLLGQLLEAEAVGASAAKQVAALRDFVSRMRHEKALSCSDVSRITRHKELLMEKLEEFEVANRALRRLLRNEQASGLDVMQVMEQRDLLLRKLTLAEADNARLATRLQELEKELSQAAVQLQLEKDSARSATDASKGLEVTRAHLQGQLRSKEADNDRAATQIRGLERALEQQRLEAEALAEEVARARERGETDKEALKKATRALKTRAQRGEDAAQQLHAELLDKEAQLADALASAEAWRSRNGKLSKEKSQLEMEVATLGERVLDAERQARAAEERARAEREASVERLHRANGDVASARLHGERLKAGLSAVEEKLHFAESEVQQLTATMKQYEGLVDGYKTQVTKTRVEADEFKVKLDLAEKENRRLRDESGREAEQMRRSVESRLSQLEPLPEMLKAAELRLRDSEATLATAHRREAEQASSLAEAHVKAEQQALQLESVRESAASLQEVNRELQLKTDALQRRVEGAEQQSRELAQAVAQREESLALERLRGEERARDVAALSRQLEVALDDARRQVEQARERAQGKERAAQAKAQELEAQLSRTRAEAAQLRRAKDDAERRHASRLQDLRDRLEQSETTNRSMQSYVHFLKTSYANVFGDTAPLASSPVRARSPV